MAVKFLTRLYKIKSWKLRVCPKSEEEAYCYRSIRTKEDVQSCNNFKGIKLISYTEKLWERVVEARLREEVMISEQQLGFMPGKGTIDAMFALRVLLALSCLQW